MAPFDQMQGGLGEKTKSIRLYVKRVFIADTFDEELIPRWLGFIKGIIDSSDLPLNVSREILQESRMTRAIKKQIVKRAIAMLETLAEDEEKFKTLWEVRRKEEGGGGGGGGKERERDVREGETE